MSGKLSSPQDLAMNMNPDPDGDSHMHSSSSDEVDADEMFPAEHEPPGPAPHNQNSVLPSSMLQQSFPEAATSTPPQSQDFEQALNMETSNDRVSENGPTHSMQREPELGQQGNLAKGGDIEHEPGAYWNNKKAREEYQTALMQIEDKNFSLKEFGDPFDESEQS